MRSSFVSLLDANRRSFAIPSGEKRTLGNDLDEANEVDGTPIGSASEGNATKAQSFANLRQMALDITLQKTEAPAAHDKLVLGGKAQICRPSTLSRQSHTMQQSLFCRT